MSARPALRRLEPVPAPAEPEVERLNKELPKRKLAAIRRRVEAASVRPAPGGSDLLADDLWRDEIHVGPRTVKIFDCTRMTSLALAGGKSVCRSVRSGGESITLEAKS